MQLKWFVLPYVKTFYVWLHYVTVNTYYFRGVLNKQKVYYEQGRQLHNASNPHTIISLFAPANHRAASTDG